MWALTILFYLLSWFMGFFYGFSIGYKDVKYLIYGLVCYASSVILYLIDLAISNREISFSGISTSEWAIMFLVVITFYSTSLSMGYAIGRWLYNRG